MRSAVPFLRRAVKVPLRATIRSVPLPVRRWLFPKDVVGIIWVISCDEVVHRTLRGAMLRDNGILLTFDDGFRECFDVIRPILLRQRATAVFFVPSEFVDNRTLLFENAVSLCMAAVERLSEGEAATVAAALGLEPGFAPSGASSFKAEHGRIGHLATPAHGALMLHLRRLEEGTVRRTSNIFLQYTMRLVHPVHRRWADGRYAEQCGQLLWDTGVPGSGPMLNGSHLPPQDWRPPCRIERRRTR